jgi:hypothetical protein
MKIIAFLSVVALSLSAGSAFTQIIDFETLPDGSPTTDGLLIQDQYNVSPFWVKFELVDQGPSVGPRVAKVGPPMTAFQGPKVFDECSLESSDADKPAADQNVGCSFLTDDGEVINQAFSLLVTYPNPVQQAGGSLLDIDGDEQWTITALDLDGSMVLAQNILTSGDEGTGEGLATLWEFDLAQDIHFIRFEYTGVGFGVGLAFDNFTPASVPSDVPNANPATREAILYQNSPNPFGPWTTVSFDLRKRSQANLTVYSVSGRVVRRLLRGELDRGPHRVVWNGRDDSGNPVASGPYFYRLLIDGRPVSSLRAVVSR